ncbi:E3 ubiquitin-protein transferase RMND5B, partial [Fragariocoptes setiger]
MEAIASVEKEVDRVLELFERSRRVSNESIDGLIREIDNLKRDLLSNSSDPQTGAKFAAIHRTFRNIRQTCSKVVNHHRDLHKLVGIVGKAIDKNFDYGCIADIGAKRNSLDSKAISSNQLESSTTNLMNTDRFYHSSSQSHPHGNRFEHANASVHVLGNHHAKKHLDIYGNLYVCDYFKHNELDETDGENAHSEFESELLEMHIPHSGETFSIRRNKKKQRTDESSSPLSSVAQLGNQLPNLEFSMQLRRKRTARSPDSHHAPQQSPVAALTRQPTEPSPVSHHVPQQSPVAASEDLPEIQNVPSKPKKRHMSERMKYCLSLPKKLLSKKLYEYAWPYHNPVDAVALG